MESSLEPQPSQPTHWQRFKRLFRRRYHAKCGHDTYLKNTLPRFPECGLISLVRQQDDGKIALCHQCLDAGGIRCAWCGNPILYGEPITLYTPRREDFEIPPHAVRYSEDPLQLVGCLGWDCADTGADRAGFWIPPGRVRRVKTAYEMLSENPNLPWAEYNPSNPNDASV